MCRDIGTRIGIARGLESCAMLADREGDPERAVLLAAAAAGLRATAGLPPLTGSRSDRYRAAADRLGDGTAARLWERGLVLTPEAAVELALGRAVRAGEPSPVLDTSAADTSAMDTSTGSGPAGVRSGTPGELTRRELEIATLVADGLSNKAIAGQLVISPATVARHVANIMLKLGVRTRAQIAVWMTGRR